MKITGTGQWRVQVGKGTGKYEDRWTFDAANGTQAIRYFNSLNVHSGYKKRLVDPEGKVLSRVLT